MKLIYGMDPLCGWCYGIGPAIRRVMADHPDVTVQPVLGGLVTGDRVGPYREMETYIKGASQRLKSVTGRAPSDAFYNLIRRDGVQGNSGPPSVAIGAVRAAHPDYLAQFVLDVTDAHFTDGADLNDIATFQAVAQDIGIDVKFPDLHDMSLAQAEWRIGQSLGLVSYPTLWAAQGQAIAAIPLTYDPAELAALVGAARRVA